MIPGEQDVFFMAAQWITTHQNRRRRIRDFFQCEENYLLFIRELERVETQCKCAHTHHVPACLTLAEWLQTLNYFCWQCAYCQTGPLQVMHHYFPLRDKGTTIANCVPACYKCRKVQRGTHEIVRLYLAQFEQRAPDELPDIV